MSKIIKGKKYNIFAFADSKRLAEAIAKKLREQKPLNKGDKKIVIVEELPNGTYVCLAHDVYSKKTQNELNNMFK